MSVNLVAYCIMNTNDKVDAVLTIHLNLNLTLVCNKHACFHQLFAWNYKIFLQ